VNARRFSNTVRNFDGWLSQSMENGLGIVAEYKRTDRADDDSQPIDPDRSGDRGSPGSLNKSRPRPWRR
jgi:hypothetical protein